MASKAAHKRLSKEYVAMQREPPPFVWAVPDEKNILTWNYIIRGPPDSPFAGGEYHGLLMFPSEYPFKPPGIKMLTPSGRFQPDKKICFSMSDFHPGTWNPAWSVATILTGLLSFMLSDEMTTGSVTTSDAEKRSYASRSHIWNTEQRRFKEAFPDVSATPIVLGRLGYRSLERHYYCCRAAHGMKYTHKKLSTVLLARTPRPPKHGPERARDPRDVLRRRERAPHARRGPAAHTPTRTYRSRLVRTARLADAAESHAFAEREQ
jgi:ubiquitin-conjugating enzyme E2 J2